MIIEHPHKSGTSEYWSYLPINNVGSPSSISIVEAADMQRENRGFLKVSWREVAVVRGLSRKVGGEGYFSTKSII